MWINAWTCGFYFLLFKIFYGILHLDSQGHENCFLFATLITLQILCIFLCKYSQHLEKIIAQHLLMNMVTLVAFHVIAFAYALSKENYNMQINGCFIDICCVDIIIISTYKLVSMYYDSVAVSMVLFYILIVATVLLRIYVKGIAHLMTAIPALLALIAMVSTWIN